MAALAGVIHQKKTDPEIGRLISAARKDLTESAIQSTEADAVLRLAHKSFEEDTRVPADLEEKKATLVRIVFCPF
jgi:Zn-dependent M32 family carboxypeptidase